MALTRLGYTGADNPSPFQSGGADYYGQLAKDENGNYFGLDPSGQWQQLYFNQPSTGPDFGSTISSLVNGTPAPTAGSPGGYFFGNDPNRPSTSSPWTYSDPSGLGWKALSVGVPLGLGAIGAGTAGLMGLGGAADVGSGVGMASGEALAGEGAGLGMGVPAAGAAAGGTAAAGGGAAVAAGGTGVGGDVLDMFGSTAGNPGWLPDAGATPFLDTGAPVLDMFGSTPDNPGWMSDPSAWSSGGMSLPSWMNWGNATGLANTLKGLYGKVSPYLPSAQTVGSTMPGLLALAYADRQPGLDLSTLNSVEGQLAGNQNAVVKAATDPLQMNIAGGYGDLLQSQGLRGIRGSSFGNTDIANYISQTGNTLGNVGANAAQGSLALQGSLAAQIAQLQNQAQLQKNDLYGRAFDTLGRGLNPKGYGGLTLQ